MTRADVVVESQLRADEVAFVVKRKPAFEVVLTRNPVIPDESVRDSQRIAHKRLNVVELARFQLSGPGLNQQHGAISIDSHTRKPFDGSVEEAITVGSLFVQRFKQRGASEQGLP